MATEKLTNRGYYFNDNWRFIIQHDTYSDGTEQFIEARTNKSAPSIEELLPKIADLTTGSEFTSIVEVIAASPDDVSDPRLQDFLTALSPEIILPVSLYRARFFLDSTNNDVVVLNFINGEWIFYRPTDLIPVPISFDELFPRSFKEVSLETVLPLIKPITITPFPPQDPSKPFEPLPALIYPDTQGHTTTSILDIFDENFGRHRDFSIYQPLVSQQVIADDVRSSVISSVKPIQALNEIIMSSGNQELIHGFIVVNFIRSYVDLFHDILNFGHTYAEPLRKIFETDVLNVMSGTIKTFYTRYIKLIRDEPDTKIFTSGGNINQTRCKAIIEQLTDDFIQILHGSGINWIPLTKENAFVKSINLKEASEFAELVGALRSDGVDTFYVESANCSIGQKLVEAGMPISDLAIGGWDAGSGFTGSKKMSKIVIGPGKQIVLPNAVIEMFGFLGVTVSDNNKELTFTYKDVNCTIPKGPVKLSVNSIMQTAGAGIVRGDADIHVKDIVTQPQIGPDADVNIKALFISLKTWTDLVQIVSISNSKVLNHTDGVRPLKIATVIYDGLCETTARLYGLGHVLKTEGSIITYYNYDINSRSLTPSELETKLQLKQFIVANKASLFDGYLTYWFDNKIETLEILEARVPSPALFFVSKLFKGIYTKNKIEAYDAKTKIDDLDVKLVPNTLTEYMEGVSASAPTLGNMLDYLGKFNGAIANVLELRPRSPIEVFLTAYDTVRQQIVNTFGDSSPMELRTMVASTFAYAFITRPNHTQFFTALDSIKRDIIVKHNETASPDKVIRVDDIAQFSIRDAVNGQSKNITNFTERYLPLIKQVKEFDEELGLSLQNISDIEIAFQVILSSVPPITNRENGRLITYKEYVQSMNNDRSDFSSMPEGFAFQTVLELVFNAIKSQIDSGQYSGGLRKKRKTLKQRKHFGKTARKGIKTASNVTSSKTHRNKIKRRFRVKKYARTIKKSH